MIPLMKSTFLNENVTKEMLAEFILTADRLSMGEKNAEFESNFSNFQRCEKVCPVQQWWKC